MVKGNCVCDTLTIPLSSSFLSYFVAFLFHFALSLTLAHTNIHKHVLHKHSFCSQMSWEREASVPFHTHAHTHTQSGVVSVGRGVSLCRNAGMISCGGVRGETHAVTARHLKTLHPALLSQSFFFHFLSFLFFFCWYIFNDSI